MCTLITNMARCRMCSTVIESTHRWDFVKCACGGIGIAGGPHYTRRTVEPGTAWQELSIYRPCNDYDCPDKDLSNTVWDSTKVGV